MRYSNNQDVINYNIEEALRGYGSYKQNHNSYYMDCPYCGKAEKLYIQKLYKYFTCFVCNEKGNIYKLVSLLKNISVKEAYKLVHNIKRENLNYDEELKLNLVEVGELPDIPIFDLEAYVKVTSLPRSSEAWHYLKEREIDEDMARCFDIRYSEGNKRVVFPVYHEDKVVGYQARDITGFQTPKILSAPGFQKVHFLYNYNNLLYNSPDYVVLVEGPVDCIKSYKHNSVALFGKYLSQDQLNLLLAIPTLKKAYIALDPEEEEQRMKLLKDLSVFWETFLVPVEKGRDLGDCLPCEVDVLIKNSKSVFDFEDRISI